MARRLLTDGPTVLLIATVWAYWAGVGIMVARVRRKNRMPAGLVPREPLERLMWLVWVPLILAWVTLPLMAVSRSRPSSAIHGVALAHPALLTLRWGAAACGVLCLAGTITCWRRMGTHWRIGVLPDQPTQLITEGLYARIRHPIYAFGILLMLSSVVVVPTVLMATVAGLHIILNILKAQREERFLLMRHGKAYREYCRRTGRFFPRVAVRKS